MAFYILFFVVLALIWLLLIGAKAHDKVVDKTEEFVKENLTDDKENV